MFYYKKIENEEVIEIGTHSLIVPSNAIEITEEEYNTLLTEFEEKAKQEAEQNAPKNPYGISDETYNNIIDNYAESIAEEVANNGY